jgi:tetratricopeptide (TPR) repeat protein
LGLLSVTIFLAACASKPPVPADPPVQAPAAEQAEARDLRSRVQRFGFDTAAPQDYAKAESSFAAAEASYEGNPDASRTAYLEASTLYRQLIRAGMKAKLDGYRSTLNDQRSQAVSVRADVAARALFQQAQADWDAAEAIDMDADPEKAIALFEKAAEGFRLSREEAQRLRAQALEALSNSDRKQTELQAIITDIEKTVETEEGRAP